MDGYRLVSIVVAFIVMAFSWVALDASSVDGLMLALIVVIFFELWREDK